MYLYERTFGVTAACDFRDIIDNRIPQQRPPENVSDHAFTSRAVCCAERRAAHLQPASLLAMAASSPSSPWAAAVTVPGTPKIQRVCDPVVHAAQRRLRVVVESAEGEKVELTFQPYQGLKVTTVDCFPMGLPGELRDRISCCTSSPWLTELKTALKARDSGADFMDRSLHFTLRANDDWIEVAAWRVDVRVGSGHLFRYPAAP